MKFSFHADDFMQAILQTGKTVNAIAKAAGVAPSSVQKAALGLPLRIDTFCKICAALNIKPSNVEIQKS